MTEMGRQMPICPVCGASAEQREFIFEKWGYPILRCKLCGLGSTWVDALFDPKSIYDERYFEGGRRDGYANYVGSEIALRAEFRRSLGELLRYQPQGDRLLEVGCAYGFFLLEAQRYFECIGVEISKQAVAFCHQRGLKVYDGVVTSELLRTEKPFDAVVMLDVVEHLPDPAATLRLLWHSLNEGGYLMITTGDWNSVLARLMGKRWRLMTPPQHLFFFSPGTLTRLLEKTGFRVVHITHPWKKVPFGLAVYQLSSRLNLRLPEVRWLNSRGIIVNLFDAVRLIAVKAKSR